MNGIFRKLLSYPLQGLLLTTPFAVTLYIIFKILAFIDGIIPHYNIPGLGILTLIVALILFGWLGTTILARPVNNYVKRMLDKAPLIKTVYSAVKDLLSAFVGQKKKFNQPVLVKLSKDSNLEKPGFITREDLTLLGMGEGKVAVYLPHSYAWSGNLFIIPKEQVTPINITSSELMKFIISGGVSTVDSDEDEENMESRES